MLGIAAVPHRSVPVRLGEVRLPIRCRAACRGTLVLTATAPATAQRPARVVTVTSKAPFSIARASGGQVEVTLRLDHAGFGLLRARGGRLPVVAVMRYAAAYGKGAQTDRYPLELRVVPAVPCVGQSCPFP